MEQQKKISKQNLSKIPTELQYVERSLFMKEVNIRVFWSFELGIQEGTNVCMWIFVGFQQRDGENSQNLNNDTFCRPPVASAQCIIRTEKKPISAISLNFDVDEYSHGYG